MRYMHQLLGQQVQKADAGSKESGLMDGVVGHKYQLLGQQKAGDSKAGDGAEVAQMLTE